MSGKMSGNQNFGGRREGESRVKDKTGGVTRWEYWLKGKPKTNSTATALVVKMTGLMGISHYGFFKY